MNSILRKFNPFAEKKEVAIQEIVVQEQPLQQTFTNYPKEVYEIHHAFETAGESLLMEAQAILKECESKSIEKGKRLISLGFKQSKEAVIATEIINKEVRAKEIYELVVYYKVNYPNNKFITETQVEAICEKWNLVCGNVDLFRGFVPEKNLKEIEGFALKQREKATLSATTFKRFTSTPDDKVGLFLKFEDAEMRRFNDYYLLYKTGEHDIARCAFQSDDGELFYGKDRKNIFGYAHLEDLNFRIQTRMKICAPLKDMDTTDMELNGYHLEKHIPDPVVLQPVYGGYLIVTAWGDEATDENVVNEGMN